MNADYILTATTVTIPAMTRDAIIRLDVNDDDLYDGRPNETVVLSLVSATGVVTVDDTKSEHTVTITDDEIAPTVTLSPATPSVTEGERAVFTVTLSGGLDEDLTLELAVSNGSSEDEDYDKTHSETQLSVTIGAGETTGMLSLKTNVDSLYEGDETVMLSLSATSGAENVMGLPISRTLTIKDNDDPPQASFAAPSSTVTEGDTGEIVVTLDVASSTDTEITFTAAGSATPNTDYILTATTVTIPAMTRDAIIRLDVNNDDLYEGAAETVVLTLTSATGVVTVDATKSEHTVTITDNETASMVVFNTDSSTVAEGGSANVLVELDGDLHESDVVVSFMISGSATAVEDYASPATTVTIPASMRSAMITFNIATDQRYDGAAETVVLTLTSATSAIGRVTVDATKSEHTITITDNETAPTVMFNTDSSTVAEGGTASVVVELDGDLHESEVVVNFTVGGPAVAGDDYTSPGSSVTIPAGESSTMITFAIEDDRRYDGAAETVVLTLTSATGNVTLGATSVHTVTITDDETAPTVTLSPATPSVIEGARAVFTVNLSGGLDEDLTLELAVSNGSSEDEDYDKAHSETQLSVTIGAGVTAGELRLKTNLDSVYEGDETVELSLSATSGGENVMGLPISRVLTITEKNEPPTLSLSGPSTVSENDASVVFKATLSGDLLEADLEVELAVVGGDALPGDYTLSPARATIPGMQREVEFTLETNDNAISYGDKTLELELRRVSDPVVPLGSVELTLTIEEDEAVPQLSLQEIASIREGMAGLVIATLDIASGQTITVELTPSHTDAQPADYSTPTTLIAMIPPGEMTATFTIMATPDGIYEGPEMLEFTLSVVGGGAGVTEPRSRQLLILDADPVPSISFVATTSTIDEDAANRRHGVELQLSGVLEDDIEVTFTVAGSATRSGMNADYTLTATTVTIPAETPDAIIRLDVNDDDLYDGRPHETVVLNLVSATGGVTVDATKDDHTVTITDDEDAPTVTLSPATPSVTEGERAVFTVTLSGSALDEDLTLELAVSNGSSEDEDYDKTHSETQLSVTIGAGETTGELSLKTNVDSLYEGDETVMLNLSATSGGENVMGLPISRELTITEENEPPVLSLSGPSTVSENDASVVFTATLSGDLLEADLEVELVVVGGDALPGDYTLSPARATIRGMQSEVEFTLQTNDNAISYGDKTVELELRRVSGPVVPLGSVELMLTIKEDEAVPQLSLQEIASIREGMAGLVIATLDIASGQTITVELTPSHTDAQPADYSTPTTLIAMIPPGEMTATFTIMATPDGIYEGPEMLEFTLSVVGGGAGFTEPRRRQLLILDADPVPSISFVATTSTIDEDAANQRHGVELQLSGVLEDDIEVTFTVAGSATRSGMNADYTLTATTVTIPAETPDAIIRLDVNDDDLYDGRPHETVVLTLTSATGDVTLGATSVHTVTITDDEDAPTVTLSPATPSVTEGERAVFTVTLSHGVDEDLTLELAVSNGSSEDEDYDRSDSETQLSVTIGAGETTGELSLKTNVDSLYEGDETVMLNLSATSGGENVMGLPISRELTITEFNALPTLSLSGPSTVSENDASVVFTATLSGDLLEADLEVELVVVGGDALPGDYTLSPARATIRGMQSEVEFKLETNDNAISYGDKTVELELRRVSGPMVPLGSVELMLTIKEDEAVPQLSLHEIASIREGMAGLVTATLDIASGQTITVELTPSHTDAQPADYSTPTTLIAMIPPGEMTATFTIMATPDGIYEGPEMLEFTLSVVGGGAGFTEPRRRQLLILDADPPPTATLSTAGLKVEEGQDASFMIRLSKMAAVDLEFNLTQMEGTATETVDYSLPTEPIVVPAGELGVTVTISTMSDAAYESTTVRFALTPETGTNVILGTPSEILLEIEELFDAVLTFQTDGVEVRDEDLDTSVITEAGTYSETLRVVLRDVSAMREVLQELPAEYQHLEVSALADIYFVDDKGNTISDLDRGVTVTISVPMSEVASLGSPEMISFAVLHDGASEWGVLATTYRVVDSEYVFETASDRFSLFGLVVLRPVVVPPVVMPPPPPPAVIPPGGGGLPPPSGGGGGGPPPSTGGGGDDPEPEPEPLTVSLGPAEQTVNEGDQIVVTVTLSEASEDDITVTLTASGGTADTDDHGLTMQETLTIAAGDETAMFTISTTDDAIYEGDETLVLSLSSSAEVERNADESEITISDNDPIPTLSLEPNNPSVREGDSVTVRARLSNISAEAISVALILEDGTAMLGSDYPPPVEFVTPPVEFVTEIAPGAEFAEFIISTIDDTVYEPDETVLLLLIVIEGNVIEGTLAGTLSIIDDDPMPALSIDAPDEIIEGTTELVTIGLNVMNVDPVTVRVSIGSGGDVSEDDYTLSSAEVTIEPGQLEATVMLSAVDDGQTEISEILVLEVAADGFETIRHQITIPAPEPVEPPDPPVEPPVTPIEPPVEPVDPPPSSDPPVPLWLLGSIVLAVLVVIVIIVVVVLRRKKN